MLVQKPVLGTPSILVVERKHAKAEIVVTRTSTKISARATEYLRDGTSGGVYQEWEPCSCGTCFDGTFLNGKCLFHASDGCTADISLLVQQIHSPIVSNSLSLRFHSLKQSQIDYALEICAALEVSTLFFLFYEFWDEIKIQNKVLDFDVKFVGCDFSQSVAMDSCTTKLLCFDYSKFGENAFFARASSFSSLSFRFTTGEIGRIDLSNCNIGQSIIFDASSCAISLSQSKVGARIKADSSENTYIGLRSMKDTVKLQFDRCVFGNMNVEDTQFSEAHAIGRFSCISDLSLYRVKFVDRVVLEFSGGEGIRAVNVEFLKGGVLTINKGDMALINSWFGEAFYISGRDRKSIARLRSLFGTDVRKLHLANIDLSLCMLYAAVGLSELSIEMSVHFARPPKGYAGRSVIADEFSVRQKVRGWLGRRWASAGGQHINDGRDMDHSDPRTSLLPGLTYDQVAIVYRMLKKAQDANGNFPGGSDFYYGEMEMRRRGSQTRWIEKIILSLYWFISGYGLRSWRAFACFVAVVVAGAVLAAEMAFVDDTTLAYGINFALRAAIPGLRPIDALTPFGQFLEIALAVIGPVFFALGAFALRARVKR